MFDFTPDTRKDFEKAAKGLALALRLDCGLDADVHIVDGKDGLSLIFATKDADSLTLKRFLDPILDVKVRAQPPLSETSIEICPKKYPELHLRGSVDVGLCPPLIDYLRARL
jgi:hypothetical protein